MKFLSSLSLFTLSVGAVSGSTLDRRDLATIQQVLTTISQQVDALSKTVKAFAGNTGPFMTASGNLLSTIRSGTTQVTATSSLNQDDALAIATYVTGLNASVATVVNDLISQKSALVAACASEVVLQDLTEQKTQSDNLAFAITSKVPADLKNLANELSKGIAESLIFGISSFTGAASGTSCSNPIGGPAAAPSSSAPSWPPSNPIGFDAPASPADSFSVGSSQSSATGAAPPALPTFSGSLNLPPASSPSSSAALPRTSGSIGGTSSPSHPSDNSGAAPRAGGSSLSSGSSSGGSSSSSSGSLTGSSLGGSSGSSSGGSSDPSLGRPSGSSSGSSFGSSSGSSSGGSSPKSVSSPPAVYTGGASTSKVGASIFALVVGCIVLFM